MARLGVETAGRAFSSINTTMVAIYCERYSLQSPWELVGRSAWSARMASLALVVSKTPREGKGVKQNPNVYNYILYRLYIRKKTRVVDGPLAYDNARGGRPRTSPESYRPGGS